MGIINDRAYDNSAYIPGAAAFRTQWADAAERFRASAKGERDVVYGYGPRERYDLFMPEGEPAGLIAFIHGGYWMAFDKSSWSHLAAGPLAHGYAVMMPSYPLCPHVRIGAITDAVGAALCHAANAVAGPIIVTGHSAGGHLAARLACEDGPLTKEVAGRLRRVAPISGLHDLRPLLATGMNETLQLTREDARAQSPALADPLPVELLAWVGDGERPELRRQTRLIALMWQGLVPKVHHVEAEDRHHFDVIADLCDPESALTRAVAET